MYKMIACILLDKISTFVIPKWIYSKFMARVRNVDNTIHRINHSPAYSVVYFVNTYPLDSYLFGGLRCPAFKQLGLVGKK